MNFKLNTKIGAFALTAAFGLTAPGFGQSPNPPAPSSIVRYNDLDLSTAAGIHTLYGRIQNAAWRVCEQMMPDHNGPSGIESVKCRDALVDAAVAQVNRPALTALHTGKPPVELGARR
jgi:UrcA family protein